MKRFLGQILPAATIALISLLFFSCMRLILSIIYSAKITQVDGWSNVFISGIRVDISTIGYMFIAPMLLSLLLTCGGKISKYGRVVLSSVLSVLFLIICFFELSTFSFIDEYGVRPNRIFVEYLKYPKEVFNLLVKGHPVASIIALGISALAVYLVYRFSKYLFSNMHYDSITKKIVTAVIVLGLGICGIRSSFGHRPLNPAMVAFSVDPTVNSLTLNSTYSLGFALKQMKQESNVSDFYGKMDNNVVIENVRKQTGKPISAFANNYIPTASYQEATYTGAPKNLVIILEESLGAEFVGELGGLPLTPNLNSLYKKYWGLYNLYATGTRSVRGIEAVVSGFTPTPSPAVVKLDKSQSNFFTIADLLHKKGYNTSFIYGGESHFDNMKSFFLGNGFTKIIDETDYENPIFKGSWGVCDEDLFAKANEYFSELSNTGIPFFSLVFSSSNHDPFEYPKNKIELYETPENTRNNAAKYADFAIGEFFKLAQKSNYWDNTIFIIVADHNSRVNGDYLVPVHRFHIPTVIIGKDIEPKQDLRLASQIDIPTTALSIIGISSTNPMIGHDLSNQNQTFENRAIMQYFDNFAYMNDKNEVMILEPKKQPRTFIFDPIKKELTETQSTTINKDEVISLAKFGTIMYDGMLYKTE